MPNTNVSLQIWNHPDVLYYFLKKRACGEDVDLDLDEATTATTTTGVNANAPTTTVTTPHSTTSPVSSIRGPPAKRGRARGTSSRVNKRDKKVAIVHLYLILLLWNRVFSLSIVNYSHRNCKDKLNTFVLTIVNVFIFKLNQTMVIFSIIFISSIFR